MKITNRTEYDGRQVAGVIRRVARDLEVENEPFEVVVKYVKYPWSAYSGNFDPYLLRINLRIGNPSQYPKENTHRYKRKDEPPQHLCHNWQEALASIAGHELMHLRQWSRKRKGRNGNVPGRYNEVETQFAEYRAWKREHERTLAKARKEGIDVSRAQEPS